MTDFEKYRNNIPFPLKRDYTEVEILVSKTGKNIQNKIFDQEEYNKALLIRQTEQERINEEFKKDLFENLGIENNPKANLLFQKAWEMGHASGYSEIYYLALDLVDLIKV